MKPLLLLNVVGLTPRMLGPDAPNLTALANDGFSCPMGAVLPAVTCSAQATMLTGKMPTDHGIVGNGWYFRELNEAWLWRQSNTLIDAPKIWDVARSETADFTCANMFWWYNMNVSADMGATPRPTYPADGSKHFGIYTYPHDLRHDLEGALGEFPFHTFWGPFSDLPASEWIARATARVIEKHRPTLALCYLPHLDYEAQRWGASDTRAEAQVGRVDAVAGELIDAARNAGYAVMVVSEYGITDVTRPVHLNRALREGGFLTALETPLGWELLDFGLSRAFAIADHQVAHVYVRDADDIGPVRELIEGIPGVGQVLAEEGKQEHGLAHPRAGELVAVAAPDSWFTYYYWLDDQKAPDFARTIDIHRKPGYDPVELFLDPANPLVKLRAAYQLARKNLGFRYLMDVISLDATIVGGSHGRLPGDPSFGPVLISSESDLRRDHAEMTDVFDLALTHLRR